MIQELGAVFTTAVTAALPALLAADLDGVEQRLQDVSRQVLGRVVEEVIAVRAAAGAPPPRCPACGGALRCAGRARPRHLHGLVGDYTLRRPYYICRACHAGCAPLDAQLGLDGGRLSPGLSRVACRLGIAGSFAAAAGHLADILRVAVPAEAVRRVTEGVGAVAEAEQQALVAQARRGQPPAADGPAPAQLVVTVDGVHAPLHEGWQEVKVGRVAPLGPALRVDAETGRAHLALGPSGYGAGLEPAEACWWRTYVEACRQGLGAGVRTVVVLGDGAEWIWTQARRFLGLPGVEVVEILDIYHAYEHLWMVGNAVFGPGTPAAAAWAGPLQERLYEAGAPPVLTALAALVPADAAAAEEIRLALGYFATHAARMDYPRFVARQLPIGSGAIESACKTVIAQRAKQAGMRWSAAGLQAVASLRALHRSGRWTAFWRTHPQRRRPPAVARPARATPAVVPAPPPAPPTPPAPPPDGAAADPRLALLPASRDDPPPPPPPTPRSPSAAPRPADDHPWRRACRPLARSA